MTVYKRAPFIGCLFILFSSQLSAAPAEEFFSVKNFSKIWLLITHPAETIAHYRHDLSSPIELQYSSYAHDDKLQIMSSWTRSNRNIAAEWRGDSFHYEHSNIVLSLLTLGNAGSQRNLNTAYRLGVHGQSYTIFAHKNAIDSSSLLLTHLDAPSVLLYGFSWVINAPQRWFKQAVFVIDSEDAPWYYLLDWLIAVPMFLLDLLFASVITILGFALAFLLHPINSLCSFGGLLYFVSLSIWSAGYEIFAAAYYLLPDMWVSSLRS